MSLKKFPTLDSAVESFATLLSRAERALIFTGAGISTGSGIRDFRGPQGVWKTRRPVYFQEFIASEAARVEYWDYKLEGYEAFRDAKPNPAHLAVARLEKHGRLMLIVTQNIDGLHEAAGNSPERIVELHGTNRRIECLDCGRPSDLAETFEQFRRTRLPPRCQCRGLLKPATVMFGQHMPQEKLERAVAAAKQADLVVSLGSTLEVEPAASVPLAAQRSGAAYVVVNQGPTAHDAVASLRLEGDLSSILPAVMSHLKSL